jgi:glycosyltransferase involved in cell wall biosynthesis
VKILIYSPAFYPSIGGLEMVVSILAHEFVSSGQEVKLVSTTPATDGKKFPFDVVRCPSPKHLLELTSWCDVFFQANVSLKGIWPLMIFHRPYVVAHHGWYARLDSSLEWRGRIKNFVTQFASNVSVSSAVADHVPTPSTVIPNPYCEDVFYLRPKIARDKELIFLGRLVSDKGADLLLEALARLKDQGLIPRLTIVGSGPEEALLGRLAKELEIDGQVDFIGSKVGEELAEILNAHSVLVAPARWYEPFGIVALEGIACGCVVVGSEGGGLKDAIGPCGQTFPNGDAEALTKVLAKMITNPDSLVAYRARAAEHLAQHTGEKAARAYLHVFEEAINSRQ